LESIKGKVKALSKFGNGFALEGINGWFTTYTAEDVAGAVVGATVEFKYDTKPNPKGGHYLNIQGAVTVVAATAAVTGTGSVGCGTDKQFRTVEELNRIDALKIVAGLVAGGGVQLPTAPKDVVIATALMAGGFVAWIDGRFAPEAPAVVTLPLEPVPEPVPEPALETTPEPAQEPSGSLDDFMAG